jgi:hypothetical protein
LRLSCHMHDPCASDRESGSGDTRTTQGLSKCRFHCEDQ